uniref:Tyrosine-protein phosphatase n=1 Tax=Rhabditophanes sp. KR3021 TaxID=114890 RepID=A0AC35TLL6_9BILA
MSSDKKDCFQLCLTSVMEKRNDEVKGFNESTKREPSNEPNKAMEPSADIVVESTEKKDNKKTCLKKSAKDCDKELMKIAKKQLDDFVAKALEKELDGLKAEYKEKIAIIIPSKDEVTAFYSSEASRKNRNMTVPCLDATRVVLKGNSSDSYFHGNYIESVGVKKRYIVCQGPLDNTIEMFIKVLHQENCEVIVQLCNFMEGKTKKCSEYIPLKVKGSFVFDGIAIHLEKRELLPKDKNVTVSTLNIVRGKKECTIRHYLWNSWPEQGCPAISPTAMRIFAEIYTTKNPILIHCSSGIRRSGVFTLICMFMDHISQANVSDGLLLTLAQNLRRQRAGAITSDIDYLFVHRVLMQRFLDRNLIQSCQNLLIFFDDYDPALKKAQLLEKERKGEATLGPMPILPINEKGGIIIEKKNKESPKPGKGDVDRGESASKVKEKQKDKGKDGEEKCQEEKPGKVRSIM